MNEQSLGQLLKDVSQSRCSVEEAVQTLKTLPFEAVEDFAKIDHHRALRRNRPEVIYCAGKTPEQVAMIFERMANSSPRVLGTRANREHYEATIKRVPAAIFDEMSRCLWIDNASPESKCLKPLLVAAGTSDIPIAEEAARTLMLNGYGVERIYDVGVAGLQRLLAHVPRLRAAPVIIVFAGMEGALPSVLAGLVASPVIAVPTSVGYGASFGGLAALLGMLNSCSPGIGVVNIDNGFGAAQLALAILDPLENKREE
jgi:hypothetical protein